MERRPAVLALALALFTAAGCDAVAPMASAGTTSPEGSPRPAQPVPPTQSPGPAASSAGSSPASASAPATILVDRGLLAVLPPHVDGNTVGESVEVEEANAADPGIPREVRALAAAFVHDGDLANWAVITIVALQPGVIGNDVFYRSWRETFDAGACEPAGGVTGSASTTLAGREVDIGRCAGGVNTYHVRLRGDRLVSITAAGELRYGELVVEGLVE